MASSFRVIIKNESSPSYICQEFDSRDKAFKFYAMEKGSKCLLSSGRIDECVDGKRCLGYAVTQGWVTFFSKDYRVLYYEEDRQKERTGIPTEAEAIKFYDSIKTTKAMAYESKILKTHYDDVEQLHIILSDLIYVHEEPKKIGFKIVRADSIKVKIAQGRCVMCSTQKATVIHEGCAHLSYCTGCSSTKKDKACVICGQESNFMEIKV